MTRFLITALLIVTACTGSDSAGNGDVAADSAAADARVDDVMRPLGLTAAQIQGRPVARVFRSPEYAEIDALIQRMGRGREGSLDREVHLRRGGQAVALLASATALRAPDGAYLGMVLAFEMPYYANGVGGFQNEDNFLITADGHESFNSLPMEMVEL